MLKDSLLEKLEKADLNDSISYNSNSMSIGTSSMTLADWNSCWTYANDYWPSSSYHYHYDRKPNSFELAFKIVSKLLETKVIQKLTLSQFIETINKVAELI